MTGSDEGGTGGGSEGGGTVDGSEGSDAADGSEPSTTRTLSTGHSVELPLALSACITGAVVSAPLDHAGALLPEGLRPLRVTPRRGAITVLSVDYDRIGDDAMAPYDEVSVQVPSVPAGASTVPVLSGLYRATSGYVRYMPVTTAPARALGREVWGYPKVVADVSIDHGPSRTRTEVTVDGERLLAMDVARPPTVPLRLRGTTYSVLDGTVVRAETAMGGRIGAWPFSEGASVAFGSHPVADELTGDGLGDRAILRIAADCSFAIGPPEELPSVES